MRSKAAPLFAALILAFAYLSVFFARHTPVAIQGIVLSVRCSLDGPPDTARHNARLLSWTAILHALRVVGSIWKSPRTEPPAPSVGCIHDMRTFPSKCSVSEMGIFRQVKRNNIQFLGRTSVVGPQPEIVKSNFNSASVTSFFTDSRSGP
jgi:hypothetical protein